MTWYTITLRICNKIQLYLYGIDWRNINTKISYVLGMRLMKPFGKF